MKLKASFTIEAALLMPLIIGTIVVLLYMSFFLHDNAVITEGTILLANRYTNERKLTNTQIKQKIINEKQQSIESKVLAAKNIATAVEVNDKKISITCNATFEFPSMYLIRQIFNQRTLSITTTKTINRANPVAFIRNCRTIEHVIKR
jgi:CRISPR/Cas system CSM-associated protein Csm3 (group 7 of RAMP superfamily)